jgi:hypothetical protein
MLIVPTRATPDDAIADQTVLLVGRFWVALAVTFNPLIVI